VSEAANEEPAVRVPVQLLLGLVLGVISGVMHPGLLYFLVSTWIIPALIGLVLQISPADPIPGGRIRRRGRWMVRLLCGVLRLRSGGVGASLSPASAAQKGAMP
jgi:hypothetical protein